MSVPGAKAIAVAVCLGVCGAVAANDRVALVIGNAAYQHAPPLANPKNDAADMAGLLRRLGFAVTEGFDITEAAMRDLIKAFDRQAGTAKVALLFYSGHGMEVDGANYLLPVDAQLEASRDLRHEAIELDFVLESMGTGTNLVFLDACRDNPFARGWAGAKSVVVVGRGLAEVTEASASGMFIAFATHPGHTAADGEGRNSPFTAALKQNIETPGLEVNALLTEVRKTVLASTGDVQRPWANSSLSAAFYFVPPSSPGSEVAPQQRRVDAPDPAAETWMQIRATANAQMLERYLATYPNSPYRMAAEARLEELRGQPFTVVVEPAGARVRLINLPAPYRAAMRLPAGEYQVKVSADGYQTQTVTVHHGNSSETHRVVLRKAPFRDPLSSGGDGPLIVEVPPGSFLMGPPSALRGPPSREVGGQKSTLVHSVTFRVPFAVGVYEVTVSEFGRFVDATGHSTAGSCATYDGKRMEIGTGLGWRNPGFAQDGSHPVVCVSWDDARSYAAWLSRETGKLYRLPSEAEWEYVARAGTTTSRYWGGIESGHCLHANGGDLALQRRHTDWEWLVASCDDGYVNTAPVGTYPENSWGLHDVLGNVWEWTADCWNRSYNGAPADGRAWETAGCELGVIRGGSWIDLPRNLLSAIRTGASRSLAADAAGFRVARTLAL